MFSCARRLQESSAARGGSPHAQVQKLQAEEHFDIGWFDKSEVNEISEALTWGDILNPPSITGIDSNAAEAVQISSG